MKKNLFIKRLLERCIGSQSETQSLIFWSCASNENFKNILVPIASDEMFRRKKLNRTKNCIRKNFSWNACGSCRNSLSSNRGSIFGRTLLKMNFFATFLNCVLISEYLSAVARCAIWRLGFFSYLLCRGKFRTHVSQSCTRLGPLKGALPTELPRHGANNELRSDLLGATFSYVGNSELLPRNRRS